MADHDELCEKADVGSLCDCSCAGAKHAIRHTKGGVPGAGAVSRRAQKAASQAGKAAVINNRAQPKEGSRVAPGAPKSFTDATPAKKAAPAKGPVRDTAPSGPEYSKGSAADQRAVARTKRAFDGTGAELVHSGNVKAGDRVTHVRHGVGTVEKPGRYAGDAATVKFDSGGSSKAVMGHETVTGEHPAQAAAAVTAATTARAIADGKTDPKTGLAALSPRERELTLAELGDIADARRKNPGPNRARQALNAYNGSGTSGSGGRGGVPADVQAAADKLGAARTASILGGRPLASASQIDREKLLAAVNTDSDKTMTFNRGDVVSKNGRTYTVEDVKPANDPVFGISTHVLTLKPAGGGATRKEYVNTSGGHGFSKVKAAGGPARDKPAISLMSDLSKYDDGELQAEHDRIEALVKPQGGISGPQRDIQQRIERELAKRKRDEMTVTSRRRNGEAASETMAKPGTSNNPPHVQEAIDVLEGRKRGSAPLTSIYGALNHNSLAGLTPEQRTKMRKQLEDIQAGLSATAPDRSRVDKALASLRAIDAPSTGRAPKAKALPDRQGAALDHLAKVSASDRNANKLIDIRRDGHTAAVTSALAKKGMVRQGGSNANLINLTEQGHQQVALARGDQRYVAVNQHIDHLMKQAQAAEKRSTDPDVSQPERFAAGQQAANIVARARELQDARRRYLNGDSSQIPGR